MSIEPTPPISALDDWLDTATRGLCDEAYARIADEIEAHVAEHVEHLQLEGLSEEDAEEKAIEALGDPRKARREFKRSHLTSGEMSYFQRITRKNRFSVVLDALYLWIVFCSMLSIINNSLILSPVFFLRYQRVLLISAILAILPAALIAYAVRHIRPVTKRVAASWIFCGMIGVPTIWAVSAGQYLGAIVFSEWLIFSLVYAIRFTRTARKLKRYESQSPNPPQDAQG